MTIFNLIIHHKRFGGMKGNIMELKLIQIKVNINASALFIAASSA